MPEHQLSVYGTRYLDNEPLYCTTANGMVWDRVDRRWLNGASLLAKVTADGHTWQPREAGIPSIEWQLYNTQLNGQDFAPPWDDTSGTASEAVVNGEDWTGATDATPPTGWSVDTGVVAFNVNVGNVLEMGMVAARMVQTLTLTPGEIYVFETAITFDTSANAMLTFGGVDFPIGPGPDEDAGSVLKCFSFTAPDSGTADVSFNILSGVGDIGLKYVRCYLESELTGGGTMSAIATAPVEPPHYSWWGPFNTNDGSFWIDKTTGFVGFDIDASDKPDLWLTGHDVCISAMTNEAKLAINAKLIDLKHDGLPCVTANGRMKKQKKVSDD